MTSWREEAIGPDRSGHSIVACLTRQSGASAGILPVTADMARKIEQRMKGSRAVRGGTEYTLELGLAGTRERIPAVLLLPDRTEPAPAAVLLHGYASRKEVMSEGAGQTLLQQGIAGLAIDLPLHGERGNPLQAQAMRNPLAVVRQWREALDDVELALRYLAARGEVDGERLAIVGYSLGSYIAVAVAARDEAVRAVVLAAGGDLPAGTPLTKIARTVADPIKAVRKMAGRPLLMVHGRRDPTIRPDQATRLFEAAGEPKEIRWWDSGHILPAEAVREAGEWLAVQLAATDGEKRARGGGKRRSG